MGAERGSTRPWELECRYHGARTWVRFSSTKYSSEERALQAAARFVQGPFSSGYAFRATRKRGKGRRASE